MVYMATETVKFSETLVAALNAEAEADGTYPVTLLTPGLGASAYYSPEVIASDAPGAFPKGTHIYMTHERTSTGEPSPEKLLGTLVEDTVIRESDGAAVNRFKPLSRWADFVNDVHKHVGLSINARGSASSGVMDGRSVKIAESIDYHVSNSVDMVSYPGRAGSGFVESAFAQYADVQTEPSAPGEKKEESNMELEEKVDKLTESVAALATLVESALPKVPAAEVVEKDKAVADAIAAVRVVESAEVPASVKDELIESIKLGNYEVQPEIAKITALRESIRTEVEAEFKESGFVGAAGSAGGSEAATVKGWGA